MFSMMLTFCALAGSPCIEVEPAEPPQSMTECMTGGQVAAAEWLRHHPMESVRLRFAGWKCRIGNREKDA